MNTLLGSCTGSVCPCPLPLSDPCPGAAPELLNAAGKRFKGSECSLHQLFFSQPSRPNFILEFDSRGELEGVFFSPFSPSHLVICFA